VCERIDYEKIKGDVTVELLQFFYCLQRIDCIFFESTFYGRDNKVITVA
jgi:hypothetical protein